MTEDAPGDTDDTIKEVREHNETGANKGCWSHSGD